MDTKLKNSKYNPIVKLVAVLLTIIFAFFTGINALSFLRKGVFYASEDGEFKNTPVFASEIKRELLLIEELQDNIDSYDKDLTYEEYLKTDEAKNTIRKFDQREERAVKLFNTIQKLKKLRPDTIETNNGTYEIDDNGIVYMPEYDVAVEFHEFYDYYNNYYSDGEYSEEATTVVFYNYEGEQVEYPTDDDELFKITLAVLG